MSGLVAIATQLPHLVKFLLFLILEALFHLIPCFLLLTNSHFEALISHYAYVFVKEFVFEAYLRVPWERRDCQVQELGALQEILKVNDIPVAEAPKNNFLHMIFLDVPIPLHAVRQRIEVVWRNEEGSRIEVGIGGLSHILIKAILRQGKEGRLSRQDLLALAQIIFSDHVDISLDCAGILLDLYQFALQILLKILPLVVQVIVECTRLCLGLSLLPGG